MQFTKSGKLEKQLSLSNSYAEWQDTAQALDRANKADRWRQLEPSRRYDYASIRIRLDKLRELRARNDNIGLLYTLNEGIHGNMGGMGKAALYERALSGTKKLVEDYVSEINSALEHLASPDVDDISFDDKLDFFHRASHCYGRTALMMSGSGSLLYFHVGVVKALWDEDLLPYVLSGSSGGAIISSIVGTHKAEELGRMFTPEFLLAEVQQESSVWKNLSSIAPRRMPPEKIREVIGRLVPNLTFQEAAELTGRQINVSVAAAETHQTSRLLNAIASPNVYIHDAVMASAAVPGIYPAVMLTAKNVHGERTPYLASRRWVDGSVSDDLPAKRLGRLYGVNHTIASQTNPIAMPFVHTDNDKGLFNIYRQAVQSSSREWLNAHMDALGKPLTKMPTVEHWAKMARSVMNQQYTADINIIPNTRLVNPAKLLKLRSEKEVMDMILAGQRATWPKLEMIRIQTMLSRSLDRILTTYEADQLIKMSSTAMQHRRLSGSATAKKDQAANDAADIAS